jgi:hypothetical protein
MISVPSDFFTATVVLGFDNFMEYQKKLISFHLNLQIISNFLILGQLNKIMITPSSPVHVIYKLWLRIFFLYERETSLIIKLN